MFLLDSQCNKCRFTLSIKLQGVFLAGRIKNVFVHPPLFIYLFIHFSTHTCWCETAGQHSVSASLSGPQLVPIDFFVFLFLVFCIFLSSLHPLLQIFFRSHPKSQQVTDKLVPLPVLQNNNNFLWPYRLITKHTGWASAAAMSSSQRQSFYNRNE